MDCIRPTLKDRGRDTRGYTGCGDYGYTQLTTGYMSEESQKARREYLMEVFDIIHATETLLRMEATDEEVKQLQQAVIEKNRKRGYYGE